MAQGLRNSSDFYSLVCKGPGRRAAEGAVRSIFVVFLSPELEPLAGVGQRADPRGVEAFGVRHQAHLLRDCVRPSDIVNRRQCLSREVGLARKDGDVLMNAVYPFQKSPRCSASSKRTRRPCMAPAVTGWTVCRFHGARGGAPKGKANGAFRA